MRFTSKLLQPEFPEDVYSTDAIQKALWLTGGQPFLLHLLGEKIINHYNHHRATLPPHSLSELPLSVKAIEDAIPALLDAAEPFFVSLLQWLQRISFASNQATNELLLALANEQPLTEIGDPEEREELLALFSERDLLDIVEKGGYQFRIPLVAAWLRRQRRLPGGK